jgi:hypothetical protein
MGSVNMEEANNSKRKWSLFNALSGALLIYQTVLLILANAQYHPSTNAQSGFYAVCFVLICIYLFTRFAKGISVAWYEFWIRLLLGPVYTYDAERLYLRSKRTIMIMLIIVSGFSVILAVSTLIPGYRMLRRSVFGYIGISALLMLVLTAGSGIVIILQRIRKCEACRRKYCLLFKLLTLQNFLAASSILGVLASAQIA